MSAILEHMEKGRFEPKTDEIVTTVTWLRMLDLDGFERLDGDTPAKALAAISRLTAWVDATRAKCLAAVTRTQTATATGQRDTADVLAGTGVSSRASRRHVRLAEKLERLPDIADALSRGDLSIGHVEAITAAMDTDPAIAAATIAQQHELIERATTETVDECIQSQRDWTTHTAETAGISLDARRRARRKTSLHDGELDMRILRAELTPEEGAIVERSLRTITDELLRAERGQPADRIISPTEHTHQLLTDALVELARRSMTKTGGRSLPHLIVHVDHTTLHTGKRHPGTTCELDDRTPITVEHAQRLLCDCTTTAVLFRDLATLAKGRTIRTANDDHWDILRARDRGCVWPECHMPPDFCQAHHIRHWTEHHGPTEPDNLVLLCSRHHHRVHDDHWTMTGPAHQVRIHRPDHTLHWQRTPTPAATPAERARTTPEATTPTERGRTRATEAKAAARTQRGNLTAQAADATAAASGRASPAERAQALAARATARAPARPRSGRAASAVATSPAARSSPTLFPISGTASHRGSAQTRPASPVGPRPSSGNGQAPQPGPS
jgi:hypothetical protein